MMQVGTGIPQFSSLHKFKDDVMAQDQTRMLNPDEPVIIRH